MGMICSFSEAIERIRFIALKKGQVYKAESVILLQRSVGKTGPDVALVKLASGEWTVLGSRHTPNGDWAVLGYGLSKFDKGVLSALVKAGVISAETKKQHEANVASADKHQRRKYAQKRLEEACAELGVPVPKIPEPAQ